MTESVAKLWFEFRERDFIAPAHGQCTTWLPVVEEGNNPQESNLKKKEEDPSGATERKRLPEHSHWISCGLRPVRGGRGVRIRLSAWTVAGEQGWACAGESICGETARGAVGTCRVGLKKPVARHQWASVRSLCPSRVGPGEPRRRLQAADVTLGGWECRRGVTVLVWCWCV